MIIPILLLAAILFLLCSCIRPDNFPPGPTFLPIIGNIIYYLKRHKALGYHHLVWMELSKKYGSVVGMKLGRNLIVTVHGIKAVREVLLKEEFDGRPDGFFFRLRTFGKRLGIVFSDGILWKKQRKFSLQHLRYFGYGRRGMEEKISEECKVLVESLEKRCGEPIFMHDAFDVSVLNALWAMLAGQRFDVEDERLNNLLRMIHDCFRVVDISGGLVNQIPFVRHIAPDACGYNKIMETLTGMWAFLEKTVEEHRQSYSQSPPRDLIDGFLQSMAISADDSFTDDQLISLCMDLFMAGAETTSNSLGFAIMYMILYPEVQKKVQKELDEYVGRNRWPLLHDQINLKYTQAVILELRRISNLAPIGIAHRATRDSSLMGYFIPKDTVILTNLYSVHMDEKVWENPEQFKPERFLDSNGNLRVDDENFIPFGLGKRRCLGELLGKNNTFLFFTSVIHNFTFEAVGGIYPNSKPFDGVTLAPQPFKARLIRRD